MEFKKEIAETLNDLLQKNIDAVEGYEKAYEEADDVMVKSFFQRRIQVRKQFVQDLREQILAYGQIPEDDASFKSTMHRAWMDIKTLFTSNDSKVILEECIRGDEAALESYKEIVTRTDLPPTITEIITRHYQEIQSALNKDRMLLSKEKAMS